MKTMDPASIQRPHEVRDAAKLLALTESMRRDGWTGRPILVVDTGVMQAWTGTHRLAAAVIVGIDVPVVVLAPDWDMWGGVVEAATDDDDRLRALEMMTADGEDVDAPLAIMRAEVEANSAVSA